MDKYLVDKRPVENSEMEANKNMDEETTPPSYVFLRGKRDRENEWDMEFDDFKTQISEMMKALMAKQETELKNLFNPTLTDIKRTNLSIENSIGLLMSKNEELSKKVEQLETQKKKDYEYITIMEKKIEDMQRTERKNNIEMKNVPKGNTETKEDLINMVERLGKSINCNINKSDVKDIYRVRGKKEGPTNTPIIVEFSSTILKANVLKMSKSYNIKNRGKLCAKHIGFTKNEDTPIFVSEQLTIKGSRLFYLARDLAKSKGYKFCWTSYGRVHVRRDENSPIITVHCEEQVNKLMQAS